MSISCLLICTDLDRTLIPNRIAPESPGAREYFRKLSNRDEITLVYISGRNKNLVEVVQAQQFASATVSVRGAAIGEQEYYHPSIQQRELPQK